MSKPGDYYKKALKKVMIWLRVVAIAGGLEISDHFLRYTDKSKEIWSVKTVRLNPGVLEGGAVRDKAAFVAALLELKAAIYGKKSASKQCNVVVAMSSANVYNQLFELPIIEGENLEKAIGLNVQMASPTDIAQTYFSWEVVRKNTDAMRYEVVSMFIDRQMIDDIVAAVREAGFIIVAAESKASSLARTFREKGVGVDQEGAYIIVRIDDNGLDFVIVRGGQLYFEYANPWREMADEKGAVSMEVFESSFSRSLHQVVNFYGQHWSDPIRAIVTDSGSFAEKVQAIVAKEFTQPVMVLNVENGGIPMTSDSFIALGAGLRGRELSLTKHEINLLGGEAEAVFQKERLLAFMRFWRIVFPVMFGVLVAMFVAANMFLTNAQATARAEAASQSASEDAQLAQLQTQAQNFNQLVAVMRSAESGGTFATTLFSELQQLAASSTVSINQLNVPGRTGSVTLSGGAPDENSILLFKKAMEASSTSFTAVNLPLSSIQTVGGGVVFSMTFSLPS